MHSDGRTKMSGVINTCIAIYIKLWILDISLSLSNKCSLRKQNYSINNVIWNENRKLYKVNTKKCRNLIICKVKCFPWPAPVYTLKIYVYKIITVFFFAEKLAIADHFIEIFTGQICVSSQNDEFQFVMRWIRRDILLILCAAISFESLCLWNKTAIWTAREKYLRSFNFFL